MTHQQELRTDLFKSGITLVLMLLVNSLFATGHFFTAPEFPFINNSNEKICELVISNETVEDAQPLINAERHANAHAILVIHVAGKLLVNHSPLRLGSRMCLIFDRRASVVATAHATAGSLLQVEHAEFVSISSCGSEAGLLDGREQSLAGIAVNDCGKVDIDNLTIRGCGIGISYAGYDATRVNDAGSVTRCLIQDCEEGLIAAHAAGFMCLDNQLRNNHGSAITISSPHSIVAGNDLIENQIGVVSECDHGVLARNAFSEDETTLILGATSMGNLITGNRSWGKTGTVIIGGHNNQLFGNNLMSAAQTIQGGKNNLLVNNIGLRAHADVEPLNVFNPPTFINPNTNNVIVPGMGRFDLMIAGSTSKDQPVNLNEVQNGLQKAREEHPSDVIVLHLQGNYLDRAPGGLQLPANTCVILNGTIRADLGIAPDPIYKKGEQITQVVRLAPNGYCSFSGGIVDGGRQVFHCINATNQSIALIDGVDIRGSVRDGIRTKGRFGKCPLFINGCTVCDNGQRGIWIHVAREVNALNNVCVGNGTDGIDLDAYAVDCNVLFNISGGNHRHGVFVEEGVHNDVVFGNNLLGNYGSGIAVWDEAVHGNTGQNVIAANFCRRNSAGISVGGRAADETANDNLLFNDLCVDNRDGGLILRDRHASDNYFAQFVIYQNHGQKIHTLGKSNSFFDSPVPQNKLIE